MTTKKFRDRSSRLPKFTRSSISFQRRASSCLSPLPVEGRPHRPPSRPPSFCATKDRGEPPSSSSRGQSKSHQGAHPTRRPTQGVHIAHGQEEPPGPRTTAFQKDQTMPPATTAAAVAPKCAAYPGRRCELEYTRFSNNSFLVSPPIFHFRRGRIEIGRRGEI